MSISKLLAQRQAAAAAPGSVIETGMQGSTPVDPMALVSQHLEQHQNPPVDPETVSMVNAPEGAYLFIRLHQLVCKGGRIVRPDHMGFYVPQNEDEESRLKHLEAQDQDWVKKVG